MKLSPEIQYKYDYYKIFLCHNSSDENICYFGKKLTKESDSFKCFCCVYTPGLIKDDQFIFNKDYEITDGNIIFWYFYKGEEITEEHYVRLLKMKIFL